MKKLSVIIPCFNEEAVMLESYMRTRTVLETLPHAYEIIYINDGSIDRTRELLNQIATNDAHVKVLHFSRNFGHQPAVSAGIKYCDADWAIIMDADLQDPPELIPDLLKIRAEEPAPVLDCV